MTPANDGLVHFVIDANASLFTVQAFASGMISVVAHSPKFAIRDMTGDVRFVPGSLQEASFQLTINVAGFDIMDEVRSSERRELERVMFDEVLEKSRFPTVQYSSSHVTSSSTGPNTFRVNIRGDLTLHGKTRGQSVEAQVVAGEDSLRAQGSFSLLQSDYGMKIASVAGGTLKLKDELKFAYFIVCRRQD